MKIPSISRGTVLITTITILSVLLCISLIYSRNLDAKLQASRHDALEIKTLTADSILKNELNSLQIAGIEVFRHYITTVQLSFNIISSLGEGIEFLCKEYPIINDKFLIDKYGKEIYKTSDGYEPIINKVKESSKTVSGFYYKSGKLFAVYATPIYNFDDANNTIVGYGLVAHNITDDAGLLSEISRTTSSNILLYAEGKIAAVSEKDRTETSPGLEKDRLAAYATVNKQDKTFLSGGIRSHTDKGYLRFFKQINDYDGKPIGAICVEEEN